MSFTTDVKAILQNAAKGIARIGTNADYTPGGNFDIFQIIDGPVLISAMWGHVRVACTANVLVPLITLNPTIGAASPLCTLAAGLIWPLGTLLTWSGLLAGVLAPTAGLGHGQSGVVESFDGGPIIVMPGVLLITNATADATAEIDWFMRYEPGIPGARVEVL
ncbi:hypothetical protein ES703_114157 [subsurface metagenome]